jgi:hypothetical protein
MAHSTVRTATAQIWPIFLNLVAENNELITFCIDYPRYFLTLLLLLPAAAFFFAIIAATCSGGTPEDDAPPCASQIRKQPHDQNISQHSFKAAVLRRRELPLEGALLMQVGKNEGF